VSTYTGSITKSRTWTISVTWELDSTPVNLTGYTLRMSIKNDRSSQFSLLTLTNGSGITITNASSGQFSITISASQTSRFPSGKHVFDVLAISPGGEQYTIFEGFLNVEEPITV